MVDRPFAESAHRNAPPILEVLSREFADCSSVLEIGSGTGQHAVMFARELPHLRWQTSDLEEHHHGIVAWIDGAKLSNVLQPITLDVRGDDAAEGQYGAAYSANTAHIMGVEAVRRMFEVVGSALDSSGVFCLYGPFRIAGKFNTQSNATFDRSLRQRDPEMGIRDLEALDQFALTAGMRRRRLYALPSNNYIAVWQKEQSNDEA